MEIDKVMAPMALFDIQKDKTKVLVGIQQVNRDPYVFVVQGIEPPPKPVKKKPKPKPKKPKPKKPGQTPQTETPDANTTQK